MKKIFKSLLSIALLAAAFASQAGVVFNNVNGTVAIGITSDISFIATGAEDGFTRFVFEDVYSITPGIGGSFNTVSNTIGLSVNGVSIGGLNTGSLWGPLGFQLGEIDSNDFTISFVGAAGFGIGDVVTLTAGTAVTNLAAAFLPTQQATEVIMTANSGTALSAATTITDASNSVPEPSSLALVGLALAAIAASRKRKV